MTAITSKERQQLDSWIDEVRQYEDGAMKWAKALFAIHKSDLWRADSLSWPKFCEKHFGYSRRKAYEWIDTVEFIEQQKKLAETNPEVEVPATLTRAKALKRRQATPVLTLEVVPSATKTATVITTKPINGAHSLDLRGVMGAIDKDLDVLLHRQDIPWDALRVLHRLAGEVKHARQLLQGVLPGFEEIVAKPKFKRPTIEEVQLFCEKSMIPGNDAQWFWNKMEGCGWKNGGKPVVDWQRTLIAWKLAGHLPSMKNGAVAMQRTLAQKEVDRLNREVSRL